MAIEFKNYINYDNLWLFLFLVIMMQWNQPATTINAATIELQEKIQSYWAITIVCNIGPIIKVGICIKPFIFFQLSNMYLFTVKKHETQCGWDVI